MAKAIINLIILEVFSFFMRLTDTAKIVKIRNMDIFSSDRRQFYQHLGILAYKKKRPAFAGRFKVSFILCLDKLFADLLHPLLDASVSFISLMVIVEC